MKWLWIPLLSLAVFSLGQTFEVASVKPAVIPNGPVYFGPARGGPGTSDPGQITWSYARLIDMLMTAYDVKAFQIMAPAWVSNERYNVIAKVPEGATKDQVAAMWQNLLAERFSVVLHRESKEFQVQELVIAKGGSKLKETTVEDPNAEGPPQFDKNGALNSPGFVTMIMNGANGPSAHTTARAQTLSRLTALLTGQVGRPVVDKTGLTGKYDFTIDYVPNLPQPVNASEPGPSLAEALPRQLGLTLLANKAKLDVLVIDKAEKTPTVN
jgi:uncharacterized protein (TIGR03435 family)